MKFIYNDGGRAEAGFKGETSDCACRAISIATGRPYKEVYNLINEYGKKERLSKRKNSKSNARTGVYMDTFKKIMDDFDWEWHPMMKIGTGCTTHMKSDELPNGTIIVRLSVQGSFSTISSPITFAPFSMNTSTIALPIPFEAPVTTATLSFKSIFYCPPGQTTMLS